MGFEQQKSLDSSAIQDRLCTKSLQHITRRRCPMIVGLQNFVQNCLSDNVIILWSTVFWPPNSPDLNPLDFYVRRVIEGLRKSPDI